MTATLIEHALHRLDGVMEAAVSYAAERMRLEHDSAKAAPAKCYRRPCPWRDDHQAAENNLVRYAAARVVAA